MPSRGAWMVGAALAAFLFGSAAAQAEGCQVKSEKRISVKLDAAPVVTDRSLSRDDVTALTDQRDLREDSYYMALGRTEVDLDYDLKAFPATAPDGNGGFCAAISEADVTISWKTTKYIAAELKPGSCMDGVIVAQEEEQGDIILLFESEAEDRVRRAILATIEKPIVATSAAQARRIAQAKLQDVIGESLDAIQADMERLRTSQETPDAVAEGRETCGNRAYEAAFTE